MIWNWQNPDWPNFTYDAGALADAEATFLRQGGMLVGAFKHLRPGDEQELVVEVATSEAMTTSGIEGEVLDRQSVRSSILHHFGIGSDQRRLGPREDGIARLMADVFESDLAALTHERLFRWHTLIMQGRAGMEVGTYRQHEEPMRIVSGPIGRELVHFEAPPSDSVPAEMDRFVAWFDRSAGRMPALTRAGLAHLYFESIHPFEDGNGRVGRAISELALAQGFGARSLTLLATEIESRQRDYYARLEKTSRGLEVTEWLAWFAAVSLAAQVRTLGWIDFIIAKSRLLDSLAGKMNARQERALLRLFREGPVGFLGGLSAGNYQRITGTTPATAGRDLAELVLWGALTRTGTGKGTRYWLKLDGS